MVMPYGKPKLLTRYLTTIMLIKSKDCFPYVTSLDLPIALRYKDHLCSSTFEMLGSRWQVGFPGIIQGTREVGVSLFDLSRLEKCRDGVFFHSML
jgi:hypothetical protein